MFEPKWFVIGFALVAVAIIASYDLRFGAAAGILLVMVAGIWLALSIWLAPERDQPRSEREAMFKRFARLARNRREAKLKELGANRGPEAS